MKKNSGAIQEIFTSFAVLFREKFGRVAMAWRRSGPGEMVVVPRGRERWSKIVVALAVSMSTGEFIEVQQLPIEQLRARFGLPASCDPTVTALNTDPAASQMNVAIDCRGKPASTAVPRPAGDRASPRPAGKNP